jgi:hypothetical protein
LVPVEASLQGAYAARCAGPRRNCQTFGRLGSSRPVGAPCRTFGICWRLVLFSMPVVLAREGWLFRPLAWQSDVGALSVLLSCSRLLRRSFCSCLESLLFPRFAKASPCEASTGAGRRRDHFRPQERAYKTLTFISIVFFIAAGFSKNSFIFNDLFMFFGPDFCVPLLSFVDFWPLLLLFQIFRS